MPFILSSLSFSPEFISSATNNLIATQNDTLPIINVNMIDYINGMVIKKGAALNPSPSNLTRALPFPHGPSLPWRPVPRGGPPRSCPQTDRPAAREAGAAVRNAP